MEFRLEIDDAEINVIHTENCDLVEQLLASENLGDCEDVFEAGYRALRYSESVKGCESCLPHYSKVFAR